MLNDLKKINQNYAFFVVSILAFVISVGYIIGIYMHWDKELETPSYSPIEINLPVVDWQRYSDLSKAIEDDMVVEAK